MSVLTVEEVKWKGVKIGDHAFVSYKYTGNTNIRIIPRATGVKIWDTTELGGGYWVINVNAIIAKTSRKTLEEYFKNLHSIMDLTTKGNLTITIGDASYTLTDCYLESFDQQEMDLKINTFNFRFIKSL